MPQPYEMQTFFNSNMLVIIHSLERGVVFGLTTSEFWLEPMNFFTSYTQWNILETFVHRVTDSRFFALKLPD